jgi:hypothetical protein
MAMSRSLGLFVGLNEENCYSQNTEHKVLTTKENIFNYT